MKTTISCKQEEFHPAVEAEMQKDIPKVEKLLSHYDPDLVLLHATFDKQARKEEYSLSLNLSLPTGTIHDVGEGSDIRSAVKKAFAALKAQLKRHQEKLRGGHEWNRRVVAPEPAAEEPVTS
jgi:ribosome-associated translation inhibitor RaiA